MLFGNNIKQRGNNLNYVVVLSGGIGTRMGKNIPKQYLRVNERTILSYCLETYQKHSQVDKIVIVIAEQWKDFVKEEIEKLGINKFLCFANAGESRQHSILNGLLAIKEKEQNISDKDIVMVQDAVRPNVSEKLITECLKFDGFDGTLPVINLQDTVYYSEKGDCVDKLLDRDKLFAGQTPEAFLLNKYINIHNGKSVKDLADIRGGCQIAYANGMSIKLFAGDYNNYKITTSYDLENFITQKEGLC